MSSLQTSGVGAGEQVESPRFTRWKWGMLIVASAVYSFYYLGRLNWGVAAPEMKAGLHLTDAELGLGAGLMFWGYAVGELINGRLVDRFGSRRFVLIGGIGTTVMNWITSFGTSLPSLYIPYTLNGYVQASAWIPCHRLVAQWWRGRTRGFADGLFVASSGLSTLTTYVITGWVAASFGWQAAFRWPLLIVLVTTIGFFVLVRDRPQDAGLEPFVETLEHVRATEAAITDEDMKRWLRPYFLLLRRPVAWFACSIGFIGYIGRYTLLTWVPLYYASTTGLSLSSVVWASLGVPLGMSFGPLVAGYLTDRFFASQRWQTIAIFFLIGASGVLTIALVPITQIGLFPMFLIMVVTGFFSWGATGPVFALTSDIGGRKLVGTAHGLVDFFDYTAAGLQGIVIGAVLTLTHENWRLVFLGLVVVLVLGAVAAWVTRSFGRRQPVSTGGAAPATV